MKKSELQRIIKEEVTKALTEAYDFTLKGTGGKYIMYDIQVLRGTDTITLSQKVNGRTSKIMMNMKQFKELCNT